jgi:hypothetical protein
LNKKNGWDESNKEDNYTIWKKEKEGNNVFMLRLKAYFTDMDIDVLYNMISHIGKEWNK